MKKVITLILALALAAGLAACGEPAGETSQAPASTAPESTAPAEQPSEAPSEDPSEEPSEEPAGNTATLGDYTVTIKGAALGEDYQGAPMLVVIYDWTNNSDDTTMALTAVSCSAFQGGVGLETAISLDADVYDANLGLTEVRPGTTLEVQSAFVLRDTETPVEVEITEWITFDDDPPMASMTFDPTAL